MTSNTSSTSSSLQNLLETQERLMEYLKTENDNAANVRVAIGVYQGMLNEVHPILRVQLNSLLERLYVLLESKLTSRSEEI